jgi:hypothetical protein
MIRDLSALFAFRDLRTFPIAAMHLIMATRLSIVFGKAGQDPLPDLAVRLRSIEAARRVAKLVGALQRDWPEHFLINRPCCMALTPDEALLGDLAHAALQGDEASATRLLSDVLSAEQAQAFFRETVRAIASIRCAQLQVHRPQV